MARVIPAQRWGVPAGAPADVTVHVKNGWLPYPGDDWHINSIGSFSGRHRNYMIVVLTADNPSMTYGVDTVQDIAEVINRDLNEGVTAVIPASAPYPSWGTPDEQIGVLPGRHRPAAAPLTSRAIPGPGSADQPSAAAPPRGDCHASRPATILQ